VSGTAAAKPTLSASAATIKSAVKAGKVTVQSGNLTITDETVKVSDLSIGAAGAGKLSFAAGGVLQGNNIIIDAETTDATNMTVKAAGKLTLGKTDTQAVTISDLAGLEAKDVEFVSHDGSTAFILKKGLTLSSKVDSNGVQTPGSGSITGAVNIDGGILTVSAGNYNLTSTTVTDGSVKITSDKVATKVTADQDAVISIANKGETPLTVSGSGAVLDLTKAKSFTVTDASSNQKTVVATANNGEIIATGALVSGFAKDVGAKKSAFALKGKGTLTVVDDLTISGSNIKSVDLSDVDGNVDVSGIVYGSGAPGGTVKVNGTLTLTGAGTAVTPGAGNNITAGSLVLKSSAEENKLGAGNFTALSSVSSLKDTVQNKLTLDGAKLTLGTVASESGEIASNITVGGTAAGNLLVAGGTWSGDVDIENKSGSLVIGGQKVKAEDLSPASASLTINKLTGTAGTVDVKKNASLTLKELANTASIITVAEGATATTNKLTTSGATGKLNISGTMSVKGDASDSTKKGVSLAGSKNVAVTDKGFLEFGATAVGSMLNADGTDLGENLNGFTAGSIDLQTGGTVKFGFDSGVTLDSTDLKKLRGVFGVASGSLTAGVLDLGNATITGVTGEGGVVSEDGTVKWT
ncbi:hypothetical protein, partial [Anaerobiospirillum sp. NML120449]|uniref:beta strand repeat-containing protein n=1 Tax=Anaerobiospirillum sp. NML120449 TaxID=2932817 RepID=UPI001FF16930